MKKIVFSLCFVVSNIMVFSQTLTQTVKGTVKDKITQEQLIGASIELINSKPSKGTVTDSNGNFLLDDILVGRQSFKISMLGYEPYIIKNIMVTSGKETIMDVQLRQKDISLNEIVVTSGRKKNKAINSMSILSSRQFTVEETQKYAGGMDDPARLVSSFAGVASPSVNNNGISIRGNSPSGLLWRVEGVEVPSPNHFADLLIPGSGLMTVLSSQLLGNSDFFSGAFPAEYGNATSGVFDVNLRKGNDTKREYTMGLGLIGIDLATEGPFKKDRNASYLLNYRYSTFGLISSLFPNDEYISYQDLSFNISIPTKRWGTFSIWGLGAYDKAETEALEKSEWKDIGDRENGDTSMGLFATSINHKIAISSKSYLHSALSFSGYGLSHKVALLDNELVESPKSEATKYNYKMSFQSDIKTCFSNKHSNKTGFYVNNLFYDLSLLDRTEKESHLKEIADENDNSLLFQAYTQSKLQFSPVFSINMGLHTQYFNLNEKFSIEPRLSLQYNFSNKTNLSFAYGLHSKIEPISIYFIKDSSGNLPNQDLDFMKSHHFVLSFSSMISDNINLTIEPYFQYQTDVPVDPESYISTINNNDNLFFNHELVSEGKGKNIGVDFTLERYFNKGLYYMFTASIFESKYAPVDGIERNTRFNKNYVFNALIGKEWRVGKRKNSFISANLRLNYLGGNRIEAIDRENTFLSQEVVYGETHGDISFTEQDKDLPIISFTASYRKNRRKFSSILTLQILNVANTKEFQNYIFNQNTKKIEKKYMQNMIPNISYKVEF